MTSPARIIHATLTQDQYDHPSNYAPAIHFAEDSSGHIISTLSRGEIPVGTPIAIQQCSCKLVESTEELKQWVRSGNSRCMQCREPIKTSDIFTTAEKINQFILQGAIISALTLPMLAIIDFKNLNIAQICTTAKYIYLAYRSAHYLVIQRRWEPQKIAMTGIAIALSTLAAFYSGTFVNTGLHHYYIAEYAEYDQSLFYKYFFKSFIGFASIVVCGTAMGMTADLSMRAMNSIIDGSQRIRRALANLF